MRSLVSPLVLVTCAAMAQIHVPDLGFNSNDEGFGFGDGPNALATMAAEQSDGKIVLIGSFTHYDGHPSRYVLRLTNDGRRDAAFNIGSGSGGTLNCVAIHTGGKILLAGATTLFNGQACSRILRLNSNGSIDATFTPGSGPSGEIKSLVVQPDGKIIIGGLFSSYNGTARAGVARLNANGTLDPTFTVGTGANYHVTAVAIEPDGQVLVGGLFSSFNGVARNKVVRLNSNGAVDASFNPGLSAEVASPWFEPLSIEALHGQSDGKVVVGGYFNRFNGTECRSLVRLAEDGSLDSGFEPNSAMFIGKPWIRSIQPCADARLAIAGWPAFTVPSTTGFSVLNNDGSEHEGFQPQPQWQGGGVRFALPLSSGRILAVGHISVSGSPRNSLIMYNADGSLHIPFYAMSGANREINASAIQPDGRIIIGGKLTSYFGVPVMGIARLMPNGSLDETFETGLGFYWISSSGLGAAAMINAIALQPDGKVVVGGYFNRYNGQIVNCIVRLNPDGSRDPSFAPGGPTSSQMIYALALQPDGRIIVGGGFTQFNGAARNRLARLMPDGSLDPSFTNGLGADGVVYCVDVMEDGRIAVGGAFLLMANVPRDKVARLLSDGSVDPTFNCASGACAPVRRIMGRADGSMYIAGDFDLWRDTVCVGIAHLNSDASLDTSFQPSLGFNIQGITVVHDFAIMADQRILVACSYNESNQDGQGYLKCLNPDGSLCSDFAYGTGANSSVNTVKIQSDGTIIAAGNFTNYGDVGRNRIIKLTTDLTTNVEPLRMHHMSAFPNPTSGQVTITAADARGISSVSIHDMSGRLVGQRILIAPVQQLSLDAGGWSAGLYTVVISSFDRNEVLRLVVE